MGHHITTERTFRFSISWRNWKTNYSKGSILTLCLFSQLWSTRYSRASPCQVDWDFPLYYGQVDTKNPLFRKQWMYFNVYILAGTFTVAEGILLKSFQKSFIDSLKIVKIDLKCKQKPWKINVEKFILCSIGRTIPIIWNTFLYSSQLFPLCLIYPH